MTSQAVMKRYLTAVSKTEEYANNKTMQDLAIGIANFKKLDKKEQAELNGYIEGAYNKLQAKGVSVKKTPTKTKTTRKTRTTEKGGLKAILAELKKKLGAEKFKEATTGTDIQKDIQIPALKKGKRIVRKKGKTTNQYGTFKNKVGTAYWESRANRFDANQPSQTRKYKLAKGGEVSQYIDGLSKQEVLSKTIVYDNGGDTIDRYTIFTPDGSVFAMSENARGFNQYVGESSEIKKGAHLGKKLTSVPKDIQYAVLDRMVDDESMYAKGGQLKSKAKYIPNRNIDEIEVTRNGKTTSIDGANLLDGVYVKKGTKYMQGGKVSNIDDEIATQELKEEVKSKMKKGDAVIHFAFTDYGGDFLDKVAIEYFEENYPKNIVVENTAFSGKNAFVFGKPAQEWIEASEDYLLGFEDFESFYYEKNNEAEQEGFEYYLGELERDGYEFDMSEVLSWLIENKGGYYNVTTQGLDYSSDEITDELLDEGLIRKEEYAKGGQTKAFPYAIELLVKKSYGNEGGVIANFKGKGDAMISARALNENSPENYEYSVKEVKKHAQGGTTKRIKRMGC
jgi:hypothetical protein